MRSGACPTSTCKTHQRKPARPYPYARTPSATATKHAHVQSNTLAHGIHTTLVGVGLDFNTDLVERISKVRGANYFSVHSPG